ncbi:MAG TPA: sigma 54-interacting transcriptional regulator [Longimicrobiaceae bacterium]|nr:sigma 54-interacting transcriptional regulator [Longimicrobiaceae bacterium]
MAYRTLLPAPPRAGAETASDHARCSGSSPFASPLVSREMLAFADLAANCGHPVLLHGETGAGKTCLAREIHRRSARSRRPFVRVNCAAIPETLFEREMFGHVRGAFTDARENGTGFFEAADGGILFLDEIGEIPLAVQPKLLAVLEEGWFRRLGSPREVGVDVQILAATNRDLGEMVRLKQFRQDLYYRFSVLQYRVPPLRERRADLPAFVAYLLGKNAPPHASPTDISEEALHAIVRHAWPGNLRELENALCAAAVFAQGGPILPEHLPDEVRHGGGAAREAGDAGARCRPVQRYVAPEEPEREVGMIREALLAARGNKTEAARALGMSRSTLWAKLSRYGVA